jgi:hypothetical protein
MKIPRRPLLSEEFAPAAGSHRWRLGFLLFLAVDALLSMMLVVGIFQFLHHREFSAHHRRELEHAGVLSMNYRQLFNHIGDERRTVYWLGPITGARYTVDDLTPHQVTVTYIRINENLYDADQIKRTVQTFENMHEFQRFEGAFMDTSRLVEVTTNLDRKVVYDSRVLNTEIVTFPDAPEVVVVSYVSVKTKNELVANADRLSPVW